MSWQNFCVSAAEVQMPRETLFEADGSPTSAKKLMELLNTVFTVLFSIELLLNFLSHQIREFFSNAWSIFDSIVVFMSLVVLGPLDFPFSILRALRVVRLFGRLESSKKILAALSVSLIPMCNAFFIMLFVAMICESRFLPHGFEKLRLKRAATSEWSAAALTMIRPESLTTQTFHHGSGSELYHNRHTIH
jgi:hypothetical protein